MAGSILLNKQYRKDPRGYFRVFFKRIFDINDGLTLYYVISKVTRNAKRPVNTHHVHRLVWIQKTMLQMQDLHAENASRTADPSSNNVGRITVKRNVQPKSPRRCRSAERV